MRKLHSIGVWAVLALSLAQSPPGEDSGAPGGQWLHLRHNGDVRALCRVGDSLWVGTSGGLFVYDLGSDEITDHVTLGERLPSNSVRAISARGDSVFVGTDGGLAVFWDGSVSVLTAARPGRAAGAPLDRIRRVDFGLDGKVYLSTYGFGLGIIDADAATVITREDSLLDDKVFGMIQEDDTTFYYATSMGLCAFRDSVWVNFQAGAGIPRAEIRQIAAAPDSGYYLVVGGYGVYRFNGYRARRITYPGLFPENSVCAVAVDAWGNLWACGSFGGIAVYRNEHWTQIDEEIPGSRQTRWRSAHADSTGGVYFGSADGLVVSLRDNVFNAIHLPVELPSGGVESVTADSAGDVYVMNDAFLLRVDRDEHAVGMETSDRDLVSLTASPSGEIWAATRWGIYRREGGRYVEMAARPAERNPVYTAIGFDGSGELWLGTEAGNIHRYDGEIWMRIAEPGQLGTGAAREFQAHGYAGVWVTGSEGGVSLFDGSRWSVFDRAVFGGRPAVRVIVSPNGIPVAATDGGIWGYEREEGWQPVRFDGEDGGKLLDEGVWSPDSPPITTVEFDRYGRLYVGTEGGLAIIDDSGTRWVDSGKGLGGKTVAALFVAPDETLWVGFHDDGLASVPIDAIP